MRAPSELEGAVLGIIRAAGSCTAYFVRSRFLESPSPQWSGSAGAIYPLVERLARKGLIRSKAQTGSRRNGRLYSVTPRGSRLLEEWLAPPLPDWVVGVPPDPLRTRLGFFDALTPAARREFVREAISGTEEQIRTVSGSLDSGLADCPSWERLVARGALASLKARRRWLKEVSRALGPAPRKSGRKKSAGRPPGSRRS